MNLATRLRRLEQTIGSGVCGSCGRVPGTERWPDGTEAPVNVQTAGPDGDPASLPPTTCPECGAWSRWKQAELFIQKHGTAYPLKDEQGNIKYLQQFPQVSIANKLALTLTRMEQEFGMTPSSRTRINVNLPSNNDGTPSIEEFLRLA